MKRTGLGCATLLLIVGLAGAGCDAFSDVPEETQTLMDLGVLTPEGPIEGKPEASENAIVCTAVPSVQVTASELPIILASGGWSATGTVTAEEIAAETTKITVDRTDASLTFTVNMAAEKTFTVCEATYTNVEEEDAAATKYTLASGSVMVDRFNEQSDVKSVNAGSYSFTFKPESSAAKAALLLIGGKAAEDGTVIVEGTYYTEGIMPAAKQSVAKCLRPKKKKPLDFY